MNMINLELTMQELQLIAAGLQEMRYKDVVNLLLKIDSQVQKQIQPEQKE